MDEIEGFQERDRKGRARTQARNVAEIRGLKGLGSEARLRRLQRKFEGVSGHRKPHSLARLAILSALTFTTVVCAGLYGPVAVAWVARSLPTSKPAPLYVSDCREAHHLDVYNIPRGAPAYRSELDADGDGWACEPYLPRFWSRR